MIGGVVYEITVTDTTLEPITYLDADGTAQTCTEYTLVRIDALL